MLLPHQQSANDAIAIVHRLMIEYSNTPKLHFIKRFMLRREYSRKVCEAYGLCANGGVDPHGEYYGLRLQRVAETASLCYGLIP